MDDHRISLSLRHWTIRHCANCSASFLRSFCLYKGSVTNCRSIHASHRHNSISYSEHSRMFILLTAIIMVAMLITFIVKLIMLLLMMIKFFIIALCMILFSLVYWLTTIVILSIAFLHSLAVFVFGLLFAITKVFIPRQHLKKQ